MPLMRHALMRPEGSKRGNRLQRARKVLALGTPLIEPQPRRASAPALSRCDATHALLSAVRALPLRQRDFFFCVGDDATRLCASSVGR